MIRTQHLSKNYKKQLAVDDLSFEVETGKVTGFLGPNGAGKSTTMRLMLGLDNGSGTTTYDGKQLHSYENPSTVAGILLEAKAFHPTRTAINHLKVLAAAGNIPEKRAYEALDIVGLSEVAKKKPGKFSLGMSQRLGIAAAILGEPKYLLLDEPANGLDPEGIAWLRIFIEDYAAKGNGVFISSHLLGELSQMVDNVLVIGKGKLLANMPIKQLISGMGSSSVYVRVNNNAKFEKALKSAKLNFEKTKDAITVTGSTTDELGKIAFREGITLLELTNHQASLEDVFLELTSDSQEYRAHSGKGK